VYLFEAHYPITNINQTCITTLALRNMVHPFGNGMLNQACPMNDILRDLTSQLSELQQLKAQVPQLVLADAYVHSTGHDAEGGRLSAL